MSFLEMSESIDMITTENKVDFLVDGKWGILGGLMGPISISAELLIELTFLEKLSGRGSDTMRSAEINLEHFELFDLENCVKGFLIG